MELEIREGEQSDKGDLIEKGKKASEKKYTHWFGSWW